MRSLVSVRVVVKLKSLVLYFGYSSVPEPNVIERSSFSFIELFFGHVPMIFLRKKNSTIKFRTY